MKNLNKQIKKIERKKLEVDYTGPYALKLLNARPKKMRFNEEELKIINKEADKFISEVPKSPLYLLEKAMLGVAASAGLMTGAYSLYNFLK